MQNGPHWRAAELHDLAAHAHRSAAAQHDKGDHETGHEHSKKAMEYSMKAYEIAQVAHRESLEFAKEQNNAKQPGIEASKSEEAPSSGQSGNPTNPKK